MTEIADWRRAKTAPRIRRTAPSPLPTSIPLDTHTATFAAARLGGYRGTFALAPVNQAGDSVAWTFQLADSAIDDLQAGQILTQSYNVTVNDGHGGTAAQTVTITITGTNDAPIITSSTQAGSVTEIADLAPGENSTTHSQYGAVTFADVDTLDTHTATFQPQAGGYRGTFALAPVNQAGDSVGWTFQLADSAIDDLQAGQILTQSYNVTVNDGHGGTAAQTVTITITGTNDAPIITSSTQAGSVTEIADLAPGENSTTHSQNGAVTFADVDTLDTHTATFQPQAGGYRGTFALAPVNQAGNSVGWTFQLADSAIDDLQAGQILTQSYSVTVNDGHGGTAAQTVTITITGTNDAPIVAATDVTGGVIELGTPVGNLTDFGTIAFSDVDLTDVHSVSTVTASAGALGSLTASVTTQASDVDGTGGVITWNYSVAASAVEFLAAGQTKVETFTFDVLDGHGGSVQRTVTVTITGTHDDVDGPDGVNFALATGENTAANNTGNLKGGDAVGTFTAFGDQDPTPITYTLGTNSSSHFIINAASGQLTLADNTNTGLYQISVIASDAFGHSSSTDFSIWVGQNSNTSQPPKIFSDSPNAVIAFGVNGGETFVGSNYNDALSGAKGDDRLAGGLGIDTLWGGDGNDTFIFAATAESGPTVATADVILDFNGTDLIDLTAINVPNGQNNAFLFGGENVSVVANSVTWYEDGGNTIVQLDNTNDTTADATIILKGTNHNLAAGDFLL